MALHFEIKSIQTKFPTYNQTFIPSLMFIADIN